MAGQRRQGANSKGEFRHGKLGFMHGRQGTYGLGVIGTGRVRQCNAGMDWNRSYRLAPVGNGKAGKIASGEQSKGRIGLVVKRQARHGMLSCGEARSSRRGKARCDVIWRAEVWRGTKTQEHNKGLPKGRPFLLEQVWNLIKNSPGSWKK